MQSVDGVRINVGYILLMLPQFVLAPFLAQIYRQPQSICALACKFPPPPSRCFNNTAIWCWASGSELGRTAVTVISESACSIPVHHMVDYNLSLTEVAFVTSFWNGDLFYLWTAKKYTTALNYIPQSSAEEKRRQVSICGWQGVLCESLRHSRGSVPARRLPWQLVAGSVLPRMCLLRAWVRADEPQLHCPHTSRHRGNHSWQETHHHIEKT